MYHDLLDSVPSWSEVYYHKPLTCITYVHMYNNGHTGKSEWETNFMWTTTLHHQAIVLYLIHRSEHICQTCIQGTPFCTCDCFCMSLNYKPVTPPCIGGNYINRITISFVTNSLQQMTIYLYETVCKNCKI